MPFPVGPFGLPRLSCLNPFQPNLDRLSGLWRRIRRDLLGRILPYLHLLGSLLQFQAVYLLPQTGDPFFKRFSKFFLSALAHARNKGFHRLLQICDAAMVTKIGQQIAA